MLAAQVLAHRGIWRTRSEQNSLDAFRRAFEAGMGLETDVRDLAGDLVISHDPPAKPAVRLDDLLALHDEFGAEATLALNIKSDGLAEALAARRGDFAGRAHYFFDMSVPDTVSYLRRGLPIYCRHSDLEPQPTFYNDASGVWLDAFEQDWATVDVVRKHLTGGKRVALVSPELHGRDPLPVWEAVVSIVHDRVDFFVCTDRPRELLERAA